MADHDHGAAEAGQSLDQRLARLHVEMVWWARPGSEYAARPRDQRKRQPRPLVRLSWRTARFTLSPENPKRPSCVRTSPGFASGNRRSICCSGVSSATSSSI